MLTSSHQRRDVAQKQSLPCVARPVMSLRAFGHQGVDLEHDFDGDDRPALVTALLATCTVGSDGAEAVHDHWWQASVGTRIAALLDLMMLSTQAGPALAVSLRCDQPGCGARFDIDLPPQAWAQNEAQSRPVLVGESLLLRRPTGNDLRDCRALTLGDADPASIMRSLLQRLCLAGTPAMEDAAEALAQADPLVAFSVHCACPECARAADRPIDLESQALQGLASCQRSLLRDVHRLASHYGWTEGEIFAVPAARRRRYLDAIAADEAST